MTPRRSRLLFVLALLAALGACTALVVSALRSQLVFFFTPTQVIAGAAPLQRTLRIGGLVEAGSLRREADGLTVSFIVTDLSQRVPVRYRGALPDLFKEGKGVVAQGRWQGAQGLQAEQVLARHDENYVPPEAAHALAAAVKAEPSR